MLRWAETVRRFPKLLIGYQEGFRQLLDIGRDADAEAILLAAIDLFPDEASPAIEHATLASTRKDWAAAVTGGRRYAHDGPIATRVTTAGRWR